MADTALTATESSFRTQNGGESDQAGGYANMSQVHDVSDRIWILWVNFYTAGGSVAMGAIFTSVNVL